MSISRWLGETTSGKCCGREEFLRSFRRGDLQGGGWQAKNESLWCGQCCQIFLAWGVMKDLRCILLSVVAQRLRAGGVAAVCILKGRVQSAMVAFCNGREKRDRKCFRCSTHLRSERVSLLWPGWAEST